jgi:hypothetical protein
MYLKFRINKNFQFGVVSGGMYCEALTVTDSVKFPSVTAVSDGSITGLFQMVLLHDCFRWFCYTHNFFKNCVFLSVIMVLVSELVWEENITVQCRKNCKLIDCEVVHIGKMLPCNAEKTVS